MRGVLQRGAVCVVASDRSPTGCSDLPGKPDRPQAHPESTQGCQGGSKGAAGQVPLKGGHGGND